MTRTTKTTGRWASGVLYEEVVETRSYSSASTLPRCDPYTVAGQRAASRKVKAPSSLDLDRPHDIPPGISESYPFLGLPVLSAASNVFRGLPLFGRRCTTGCAIARRILPVLPPAFNWGLVPALVSGNRAIQWLCRCRVVSCLRGLFSSRG